ncbi:hypothetical protein MAP00_008655 [Monascus purpureus]|nr:hypothetical protein MAP00_008655 [Monascus purpureus]
MAATGTSNEGERCVRESVYNRQLPGAPVHPIPRLQGPFEESIIESNSGASKQRTVDIDAQTRRRNLLERAKYERLCGRKWCQMAGERYHPLWKLISQISFGMHLLAKGLAISDTKVMKILQGHVDELDDFLERVREDFSLIQLDVRIRIRYLRLPLDNLDVFDEMLVDRNFRASIIDYNEKIEFAIERFGAAVNDSLKDINKGMEAMREFWHYLRQLAQECTPATVDLNAIYEAMVGNVEGWNAAFSKLDKRGIALASALSQLGMTVTEMQRRVGLASRKDVMPLMQDHTVRPRSKSYRGRLFERRTSVAVSVSDKPLPSDPDLLNMPTTRSVHQKAEGRIMMSKSVTDLRIARELSDIHLREKQHAHRSMSLNDAANDSAGFPATTKSSRSISGRFSRTFRTKRSESEKLELVENRPVSTSHDVKTRGISLDRLKSIQMNRKSQRPESMAPQENGHTTQGSARRQKLRDQLSYYFKSDGVIDAWETSNENARRSSRFPSAKKKDWPRSIFRTKDSNALHAPTDVYGTKSFPAELSGTETDMLNHPAVLEDSPAKQMNWMPGKSDVLHTYWLKPNDSSPPRLPVFSVPSILTGDIEDQRSESNGREAIPMIAELA